MGVNQLFDLHGRTALVTGGSRGLGLQMAEALGELGARVVLVARKRDELDTAVGQLGTAGIDATGIACDLSDIATIAPMVDEAEVAKVRTAIKDKRGVYNSDELLQMPVKP